MDERITIDKVIMNKRKFIVELSVDWCDDSFEQICFDIQAELSCCWHHFIVESIKEIRGENNEKNN